MSKAGSSKPEGEPTALTKRPRTEVMLKTTRVSGLYVQIYDHHRPWSLATHRWHLVDSQCFNVTINEQHLMGFNIVSFGSESAREHFTIIPYGPDGLKCTDRDGCGGAVQRGQALRWKCNCLLHFECGPVCADVMVVFIESKERIDGMLHVEKIVRTMFHVVGDDDITEPCWLQGSIEQNQRDISKHHAAEASKEIVQLKLEYQNMKQLMQAQTDRTQQQLQVYKESMEAITKIATCSICIQLMPEKKPGMLAECGHYICAGCHEDYYHGIGPYEAAQCSVCHVAVGPKQNWQKFFCMTGVVEAIKKTITVEEVD